MRSAAGQLLCAEQCRVPTAAAATVVAVRGVRQRMHTQRVDAKAAAPRVHGAGKTKLTRQNSLVTDVVKLPCSGVT